MKRLILALFLTFGLMGAAAAEDSRLDDSNVDLLVEGVRNLDRVGLYRVRDPESGYIIYILKDTRTNSNPQLYVVPSSPSNYQSGSSYSR